jgi:hypothetical protein
MAIDGLLVFALGSAAVAGIFASVSILRRDEPEPESPYAVSTEGEKRCPKCGMGNMWTDSTCASCGAKLAG